MSDETAGLSRREREKLRQRQEILQAALTLFSVKGYHNVSMHEIAEKSEFAIGTLYKFFKNKEALYTSLVSRQVEQFDDAMDHAIACGTDEVDRLRKIVTAKFHIFQETIETVRLYFSETHGASFNVRAGLDNALRKNYYDAHLVKIAKIFESGTQRGLFAPIAPPYALAMAFDTIITAFLLAWLEDGERHPLPEDPDVILNMFFMKLLV